MVSRYDNRGNDARPGEQGCYVLAKDYDKLLALVIDLAEHLAGEDFGGIVHPDGSVTYPLRDRLVQAVIDEAQA